MLQHISRRQPTVDWLKEYMHDCVRHFGKQKTVDDGAWVQEAMWD
jgi:hypothetical protein